MQHHNDAACSDAPISSLQCQVKGWKERGHKAACKLLARAKALPPADPERRYIVQIKLVGPGSVRASCRCRTGSRTRRTRSLLHACIWTPQY